ncbi:MAG: transglutaminase-like domain-containing protein [Polymorphobacter sp.]
MRVHVATTLAYQFASPVELIAKFLVAHAPGQTVVAETLVLDPATQLVETTDASDGSRTLRGESMAGVRIDYTALVDIAPRIAIPDLARQCRWSALPADALRYLLPSRYCPSDKFGLFVARRFPAPLAGGARVKAILDWIHRNIDYRFGVSTSATTAEQTFVDRAGVCRDFAHLAITLCRACNIPARAVAAYAHGLVPQDFHAVVEVYLDGGWWIVDPTRLAPINGLVRIAAGRDAADIAFLTTDLGADLIEMRVEVTAAAPASLGSGAKPPPHCASNQPEAGDHHRPA